MNTDPTPVEQIQSILNDMPKPTPDELATMEDLSRQLAMLCCITNLPHRLIVLTLIANTQAAVKACLIAANLTRDREQGFTE